MARFAACVLAVTTMIAVATESRVLSAPIIASPTGLAAPDQELTFDEIVLSQGQSVGNSYSGFGVTFSGLFYNTQPGFVPDDPALANYSTDANEINPFSIAFSAQQSAAAFILLTNPGTTLFEALLNGSVVESFTTATGTSASFYGFSNITFDEIRMTADNVNGAAQIDTLQSTAAEPVVPEPTSMVLMTLGGIGLVGGAIRRRRKAA